MNKIEQSERLKEMRRLYEVENLTLREIGDCFGVSRQTIHNRLVKAGVSLRKKGACKKILTVKL